MKTYPGVHNRMRRNVVYEMGRLGNRDMGVDVGCQGVHDKGWVMATQPPYLFVKSPSPVLPPPP